MRMREFAILILKTFLVSYLTLFTFILCQKPAVLLVTNLGLASGVKKDGSSIHFFHRTSNAYATGQRKRRKIHRQSPLSAEHVRWHKTGKTKPVIENGVHKGWKKIMVLYKSSKRGSKPHKSNWVIHQYHLGTEEDEKEGELVVSKVFYQQQSKQVTENIIEESDTLTTRAGPKTPKTNTPHPPRSEKHALYEEEEEDKMQHLSDQVIGILSSW